MLWTDYKEPSDLSANVKTMTKQVANAVRKIHFQMLQNVPLTFRLEFLFSLVVDSLKTNSNLLHHRRAFHYLVNSIFINCAVTLQSKYIIYWKINTLCKENKMNLISSHLYIIFISHYFNKCWEFYVDILFTSCNTSHCLWILSSNMSLAGPSVIQLKALVLRPSLLSYRHDWISKLQGFINILLKTGFFSVISFSLYIQWVFLIQKIYST